MLQTRSRRPGSPPTTSRPGVPWLTVLSLAIILAFADGFWAISLRTAVGDITRAQTPFVSWLRESIVAVPVFALAVLCALTLAMSRWRADRPPIRAALVTASLVVVAATLAGVGWLGASGAYDYHLQLRQLSMMGSMGGRCAGGCLARQREATLFLQLKAVGYGGAILLVTNLAVVAWMVAMRGGRLEPFATRAKRRLGPSTEPTRAGGMRLVLVAGLLASAVVEAAGVLAGDAVTGFGVIGLSALQTAVAVQLVARRTRSPLGAAVVVSLGALAVSACSVAPGSPFTPSIPGAAMNGVAAAAVALLALGTLGCTAVLLGSRRWIERPPPSSHQLSVGLVAIVALTTIGLAGPILT